MPITDDKDDPAVQVLLRLDKPECIPDKPKLWFAQLEAQFGTRGIVEEKSRYNATCALLPAVFATEVEDVIVSPPVTLPYSTLKTKVIESFTRSKQANLLQLLDREQMGESTPSQFLRRLKSLVPDIDEEVLKAKWLSRLPRQIHMGIANQTAHMDSLARAADNLFEILRPASTTATTSYDSQLAQITRELAALKYTSSQRNGRSRSRAPPNARGRSSSRSRARSLSKKFNQCWYHFKFGTKARNCVTGCKFQGNRNESS